jgi:ribosomal protein S18 acetylase RimI-like enzyme
VETALKAAGAEFWANGQALAALEDEPFDSRHFGRRMGRISACLAEEGRLSQAVQELAAEADRRDFEHLVVRAFAESPASIQSLEGAGFRTVDIHTTLVQQIPAQDLLPASDDIRPIEPHDVPAIQEIGRDIFAESRYACDPGLSAQGRQSLFMEWIANDCGARGDLALGAFIEGRAAGFITTILRDRAIIDLIAVAPWAQGRGLGKKLISEALRQSRGRADEMEVGTQGSNRAAHMLYNRCGFVLESCDVTLHRWGKGIWPK